VQGDLPETYRLDIVSLGDSLLRVKRIAP
jgi:hypothetical protein